MSNHRTLKQHKLVHVHELHVNENILERRFAAGCSISRCNADCCKGGVWTDPKERSNILAHTTVVQRYMDSDQEHRPEFWFDEHETRDTDFPSGQAIGTRTNERGCVFLKRDRRCVLQTAAEEEGMDRYALKPFFCVAFPITIENGELMVDDLDSGYRPECCCAIDNGEQTVFDVYSNELRFVLGEEGLRELYALREECASDGTH